jgi:histo-blood group ABO system transferase
MKNIGLVIIATNKYIRFLQQLVDGADKYFLPNHNVTYFVFSDKENEIKTNRKVIYTHVEHKSWPWMTLGRYEIFDTNSVLFDEYDYLYYCDVDMKFVDTVGDEILSDVVVTQHPLYTNRRGTPETNPISKACVYPQEKMQYFAGGFNGGSKEHFLKMSKEISKNIKIDFEKNFIAVWHDESHLNRYMIDNTPTKILSPSYCYPESMYLPYHKKLLALDKNHKELRS